MVSEEKNIESDSNSYPPVVAVLGHVDHGKTSLLDAIRKTNIASAEHGGITQKIGASQIEVLHDGNKRTITFIDTPGHEAFANMRSQGVSAADIVLLVVASDDGPKPQTIESIQKIKESNIPYIVVLTKADIETAQPDRVKQLLMKEGVLLEGLGGEVPYISVSSKTGLHIQDLLDLILLSYDLNISKKDETVDFTGVVIDSKRDARRGIQATVVVKSGTFSVRDDVYNEATSIGKVKALLTSEKSVSQALPGDAVVVLGLTEVVPTGTVLSNKKMDIHPAKVEQALAPQAPHDLATFFGEKKNTLPVILRAESSGEMEAIKEALPENIEIVFEGQGEITVTDMLMAKDLKAIVIGFNVKIAKEARAIAEAEGIFHKTYTIIYELLDEIKDVADMLLSDTVVRQIGKLVVLAIFEGSYGTIIGGKVLEGRIAINDKIKVLRGEDEIGDAKITSLKREKKDVKEAGKETECGIMLSDPIDIKEGDVIIAYK